MQMVKSGYVTKDEYAELSQRPLGIHFTKAKPVNGSADYFQAFLRQYMMAPMLLAVVSAILAVIAVTLRK